MYKQLQKFLAGHLVLLIVLHPGFVLSAEIIVDTSAPIQFQPDLVTAPSGTPVVNITRPTAGGVSRNMFSDYSVGEPGLILNNSTGLTKTELAGYILANPNLQCTSARLILNEVTGTKPSILDGYTEIAGAAADLIIANPNGISISGGGFINTPRVTLTTGVAEWQDGNFIGLRVEQGQVNINGQGLNVENIDRLDIYARAISLNAKLWAQRLDMVTGQNRIAADGSTVEMLPGDHSPAPQFALDSTALGGMYANQISLLGTEKGVGVHLAGDMAASGADIRLTIDGRLELLARMTGKEGVSLDAGEITIATTGEVLTGTDLHMSASSLLNEGSVVAADDAIFSITDDLTNRDGLLFAFNNMSIYGTDPQSAVASFLNDSGRIETWQGDLAIRANQFENRSKAPVIEPELYRHEDEWVYVTPEFKTLDIMEGYRDVLVYQDPTPSLISAGHDLHIQAENLSNLFGTISAANHLVLEGEVLENSGLDLIHESTTTSIQLVWKMKHTQFHTTCKKTWQLVSSIVDGPYSTIIGSIPAVIESGGDLTAIFDTSIGNGEQRESIMVDKVLLPEGLEVPVGSDGSAATISDELSGLFQSAALDQPYLVETRPLFADKVTFVNSDYLLGQLDYQPNETLKRLGDGFYETVLIRDSIQQQTGQRFLDAAVTSDSDQYTRLMDAALVAAEELELSVGVALNRAQIASLTHDIVWFVTREVDGQTVLVPQLYLAQLQPDNLTSGSRIVATGNVSLLTGGNIANSGEIAAGNNLNLAADEDIQIVDGELSSGNMTMLVTGGNIFITGGRISGEAVALQAEEAIAIKSRHQVYQNDTGYNTVVGRTASIKAENDVTMVGNDIVLAGTALEGGVIDLAAQQNLSLTTIEKSTFSKIGSGANFFSASETSQVGSSVKGNTVSLYAGEDLTLYGSQVEAQQDGQLVAGGNLTITSAEERSSKQSRATSSGLFSSRSSEHSSETVRQRESVVEAGRRLDLYAGVAENDTSQGDITIGGSRLNAGADLSLYAAGNIMVAATDESSTAMSSSRKNNLISNRQDRTAKTETTLKQSELHAGNDLLLRSDNDISMIASSVDASGDAIIIAGEDGQGNINLLAGDELEATSIYHRKGGIDLGFSDGFFSFASVAKNSHETSSSSSVATTIKTGGDTILLAANDANLIGADIASGGNLYVDAERDANILAAAEHSSERSVKDEKKFGVAVESNPDNVSVFFGVQSERDVLSSQNQLTAGSSLTAAGTITVDAGRNLNQVGSAIAAGQDLQLRAGDSFNSLAGEEVATVNEYSQLLRIGITTSLQHNIGSAVDSTKSIGGSTNPITGASRILKSVDAIDRITQPSAELFFGVSGSRSESEQINHSVAPSSLYAGRDLSIEAKNDLTISGTTAVAEHDMLLAAENVRLLAASNSHLSSSDSSSFKAGLAVQGSKTSGSIAIAGNGSGSNVDSYSEQLTPTQIMTGGSLVIAANSDIEMEGSQISVEQDLLLQAGHMLDIHAAENSSELSTDSHQFGAAIGLSVSGKDGEAGLYANLNGGLGQLERENSTYLNTHIDVGNLLDLSVQGDARIKGATLVAEDIHADIAGDLLVASISDRGEVDGEHWNAGITVSQSGASGISVGEGQTSGHKDWIEEQTSLIARDSVDLTIGGHTQLDAAIIASEIGNLKLDTETFAYTDHSGNDTETSYDVGIGFNSAGGGPANQESGAGVDNNNVSGSFDGGYSSHDRQQEVRATIGVGEVIVRSDLEQGINSPEDLNRDLNQAYEITRDTSNDYELYVSSGALDRVSNPTETASYWTNAALTYGRKTVAAVKGFDNIIEQSEWADNLVGFVDLIDLPGVFVGRENYGGWVTQLPSLLTGDMEFLRATAILKRDEKLAKTVLGEYGYTEFDPTDPAQVKILNDFSKYLSINGMANSKEEAITNGAKQTGAINFVTVYNTKHGFIGDLLECAWDETLGYIVPSGSARQAKSFMELADSLGVSFNVASHSQGSLITFQALDGIKFTENWRFQFFGAPVYEGFLESAVSGADAEYEGSYANIGEQANDTISTIIGFNARSVSEVINGFMSAPLLLDSSVSPHSNYYCQSDFCAGEQSIFNLIPDSELNRATRL